MITIFALDFGAFAALTIEQAATVELTPQLRQAQAAGQIVRARSAAVGRAKSAATINRAIRATR